MERGNRIFIVGIVSILLIATLVGAVYYSSINNPREELYSNLPIKSSDFETVKSRVEKGIVIDMCLIGESYYKQPNFYPRWNEIYNQYYKSHDYTRWGVYGYGTYPSEAGVQIRNLKQGESLTTCTIVRAGYGIETWQGIQIELEDNEYFDVEILTQDYSEFPNTYVLGRTYPMFDNNWAKLITLKITAKQDIPVGSYQVNFNIVSPETSFNNKMMKEILFSDTDETKQYVESCIKNIKGNEQEGYFNCQNLASQRQKLYVPAGIWKIGRNSYEYKIEVI